MPFVAREVKLYVGIHQLNGLGAAVHRVHQLCPTPHGIDAETACVAEHIEHLAPASIAFHQGTIVALVDEEACLLPLKPVDVEGQSVLVSDVVAALSPQEAVLLPQLCLEGQRGFALVVNGFQLLAEDHPERLCQLMPADMHANAVCLHDSRRAIDVDDTPWQVVAFAMDKSVGIVPFPVHDADAAAHLEGCGNAFLPESQVDALTLECKDTHSNAAYLPMTNGKELPVGGHHLDYIAFFQRVTAFGVMDGTAEYPGVITPKALFFSFAENYLFQFIVHSSFFILSFLHSQQVHSLLPAFASWPCRAGRKPKHRWRHIAAALRSGYLLPSC